VTIDYDTYASKSPLQKVRILSELTPANIAELVIVHWRRWLESNRHRLNGEQIAFLEEQIAYIKPELYVHPRADEEAEAKRSRETEERMRALFPFEDFIKLHMEAFKNSGEIRNPIALILVRGKLRVEEAELEELRGALRDLATVPPDELRSKRPDLPAYLRRRFEDPLPMPEGDEFWSLVSDEDVTLAAARARALAHLKRAAGGPPPPDPQR